MAGLRNGQAIKRAAIAVLLCAATWIFFWQWRHPVVRFTSPGANELFGFILATQLPCFTLIAVYCIGPGWSKAIAIAAAIPLLLYWAILPFFFMHKDPRDLTFDSFAAVPWRGSNVRLYRMNGGATTDFGVVIRQERGLLPGVILVRQLDNFYPCYSLDVTAVESGVLVSRSSSACSDFQPRGTEYRLKPFLYF